MQNKSQKSESIKKITLSAGFVALAFVSTLVTSFLPKVQGFLSIDVKDAVIVIAGYILSPLYALVISFISCLIELIFLSGTGFWGFVMNFISTSSFVVIASMLYSKKRKINTAVWGLCVSVIATTVVMLAWNYIVTPWYMHVPRTVVADMLLPVLLPFNLVKYMLNAGLTMLLYKPLSKSLTRAGVIKNNKSDFTESFFNKRTVVVGIGSVMVISASVLVLLSLYGVI